MVTPMYWALVTAVRKLASCKKFNQLGTTGLRSLETSKDNDLPEGTLSVVDGSNR
jgi:hypothetical protein